MPKTRAREQKPIRRSGKKETLKSPKKESGRKKGEEHYSKRRKEEDANKWSAPGNSS